MSTARAEIAAGPQAAIPIGWRAMLDEGSALLRLAWPIMLIALVNMGMGITDTLMVSMMYGAEALAAVSVGSDLYSIVFYICAGTLGGIAPFYAGAVARQDAAGRAGLERIGWAISALLALPAVPLVWFAPRWLQIFGLDAGLLQQGEAFTQVMALTLIPMLGVTLYRTLLTAAENPHAFLKVTLAMLPLNAIGNYVLMQGVGPIPAFGPTGSGLATLLVATGTLAVLLAMARHNAPATDSGAADSGAADSDVAAACLGWRGPDLGLFRSVLRVGLPIGVMAATETGIFLAVTLYAATLRAADVAAHTLTLRMAGIAYAGSFALQQSSVVRMARAIALKDTGHVGAATRGSLALSFLGGALLLALLGLGAEALAAWFFDAGAAGLAAIRVAIGLLALLGLLQFVGYPGLAALGLLRGQKDTRMPMVFKLVAYWCIGAPLGIWLCEIEGLGVTGLWIGLITGACITTVLTLARLYTRR
jgi:MATE family multidrug resistance protein